MSKNYLLIKYNSGKGYFVSKKAGSTARLEDLYTPDFGRFMGLGDDVDTTFKYVVVGDFNGIKLGIKPVEAGLWEKVKEAYFNEAGNENCYEVEIVAKITVE